MSPGRVVVVGMGPAGVDLLLPAARGALESTARRFVRTSRHPAVGDLAREGIELTSFDACYERADHIDDVYDAMVAALLRETRGGATVVYAVPGSPTVAERSVALLHEAAARGDVDIDVVPGLSFAELAFTRLGPDPTRGARVVDGHRLGIDAAGSAGPLLVAQCDTRAVLSDVKLTLLDSLDPDTPVTVLQRLGCRDERVWVVPLASLDRVVEPDHLTALFVDTGTVAIAPEFARFVALVERLRRPGGCPWDAEQTHHSLSGFLLEEAYEVVEAIEALPTAAPDAPGVARTEPPDPDAWDSLADELGDVLYQVVFHAVLAGEAGAFTIDEVIDGVHTKLVRRHPHVFGTTEVDTAHAVVRNWEQIKKREKGTTSLVAGITPGLPSLLYAHKLASVAASVGLDPGDGRSAMDLLGNAARRLEFASDAEIETVLGELLAAAVMIARSRGVDAESALRGWSVRFRDRFAATEELAAARGLDLATIDRSVLSQLWEGST